MDNPKDIVTAPVGEAPKRKPTLKEVLDNAQIAFAQAPEPLTEEDATYLFYPNPAHESVRALYQGLKKSKHPNTRKPKARNKVKHGNRKKK